MGEEDGSKLRRRKRCPQSGCGFSESLSDVVRGGGVAVKEQIRQGHCQEPLEGFAVGSLSDRHREGSQLGIRGRGVGERRREQKVDDPVRQGVIFDEREDEFRDLVGEIKVRVGAQRGQTVAVVSGCQGMPNQGRVGVVDPRGDDASLLSVAVHWELHTGRLYR